MSIKSIKFHIENDDYFGTLSTILSLISQTIGDDKYLDHNIDVLGEIEEDLMFLQDKYLIKRK